MNNIKYKQRKEKKRERKRREREIINTLTNGWKEKRFVFLTELHHEGLFENIFPFFIFLFCLISLDISPTEDPIAMITEDVSNCVQSSGHLSVLIMSFEYVHNCVKKICSAMLPLKCP